jgi:A/G-specific adenine glycosylase
MTKTKTYSTAALLRALRGAIKQHYRDMPWRQQNYTVADIAYRTLVSEIMLQQTQVSRVAPKFTAFMQQFPDISTLANAPLADVLVLWSGLGYNRRAKYLHEAAKQLQNMPHPWSLQQLQSCKGIGVNTAAAIRVYAYNFPEIFIETNIRTVLLHYVFAKEAAVLDSTMLQVLQKTIPKSDPKSWYWALMDEGARLKSLNASHLNRAVAHKKQTTFSGSARQLRGKILKLLTAGPVAEHTIHTSLNDQRSAVVLHDMQKEGLLYIHKNTVYLGQPK